MQLAISIVIMTFINMAITTSYSCNSCKNQSNPRQFLLTVHFLLNLQLLESTLQGLVLICLLIKPKCNSQSQCKQDNL